jgi:hypothetical protein
VGRAAGPGHDRPSRATASAFRNYTAIIHLDFGWALLSTGKTEEAESEYRKAQAIHQKLTDENPSVTERSREQGGANAVLSGLFLG